jgi:hypothetical protein
MGRWDHRERQVMPIPQDRELSDLEEVNRLVEAIDQLKQSKGYHLLRQLADEVAWGAYSRMIGGNRTELDVVAFAKGQIAGLESLFQNLNNLEEEFKMYVKDLKEAMENGD